MVTDLAEATVGALIRNFRIASFLDRGEEIKLVFLEHEERGYVSIANKQ